MRLRVPAPRINDSSAWKASYYGRYRHASSPFFETTAQFWMNLQSTYDLKVAEKTLSQKIISEVQQLQKAA